MSKVKYTKDDGVKFPTTKEAEAALIEAGWKKDAPKAKKKTETK